MTPQAFMPEIPREAAEKPRKAPSPPLWQPGLDNADATLGDVLASMPKDPPDAIPWSVKILENPRSPLALAGAIDLFGHDCIHVLLGRGIESQDEAFVIGFTMGASKRLRTWQELIFRWCSAHLYRGVYRFSALDHAVYDLGVAAGRWMNGKPLHEIDWGARLHRQLGDLRRELGLRLEVLHGFYELERSLFPDTAASRGLPTRFRH